MKDFIDDEDADEDDMNERPNFDLMDEFQDPGFAAERRKRSNPNNYQNRG